MTRLSYCFTALITTIALGTPLAALAQSAPAAPPAESSQRLDTELPAAQPNAPLAPSNLTEAESAQTESAQTPAPGLDLDCPPGQFRSAFLDVTPNDWAFDAVNRLAGLPQQCFPWSP